MDKYSVSVVCTLQITLNSMGLGEGLANISYTLLTLLFFFYIMYLFHQNYVDFVTSVFFIIIQEALL